MEKLVKIGVIASAHGMLGKVKVKTLIDNLTIFEKLTEVTLKSKIGKQQLLKILGYQLAAKYILFDFQGVSDRDAAQTLRGNFIMTPADCFAKLPADQYYNYQLMNAEVCCRDEIVGKVRSLVNFGAGDIVEMVYKQQPAMLPFTKQMVEKVETNPPRIFITPTALEYLQEVA